MELREYIVTLHKHEDLEGFYEDMETPGGSLYIPDRAVTLAARRPISRNTHYMLTDEEAELVKNDNRVLDCELKIIVKREPGGFIQTSSNFNKDETIASGNINWGLLRCERGSQISGWGTDGTSTQSGTVTVTGTGKNVDVVIIDGHLNPNHPEFAKNPNGTGGTRVIQYNWYQHNPQVTGGVAGTYVYPSLATELSNGNDNHGMHVAGTAVGNTQGWARDANIYNISPYGYYWINQDFGTYSNWALYENARIYHIDYIREFHKNKPINPTTGIKNPTITTGSYWSPRTIPASDFVSINYRGQTFTSGTLSDWFIRSQTVGSTSYFSYPAYSSSFAADMEDAIDDGIILVSISGNNSSYLDVEGGSDYNNQITHYWDDGENPAGNYSFFCHRGSDNAAAPGVICVGSVSEYSNESKASYSGNGPRVDVYSPGTWIISSVHDGVKTPSVTSPTVNDPRNLSYKLAKYRGTSMACPQVTGILACALENNPRMTPADCLNYLKQHGKINQMTDGNGTFLDTASLLGSDNRYLYYKKQRETQGYVTSQLTNNVRKPNGMVFPRRRFV
jgi:hypothetical protein